MQEPAAARAASGVLKGGGRCNRARKRVRFKHTKRVKVGANAPTPCEEVRAVFDGATMLGSAEASPRVITKVLASIAPLLWSSSFSELLNKEMVEDADL